jgi:hypothetical protein
MRVFMIGVATHFQETPKSMFGWVSACGIISPHLKSTDPFEVDCLRCRKTKLWRKAMKAEPIRFARIDNGVTFYPND